MKLSKIFHVISALVGLVGVIMFFGAWSASTNGSAFGLSETHLFNDATALILIAIWLQLGTMHHMKLEEKGKII